MSGRSPAKRLARFMSRRDVESVARRHERWSRSSEGIASNVKLALLAMLRSSKQMSARDYKKAIRQMASTSSIPVSDFQILAKIQLEISRCSLAGTGKVPFTPSDWDREEGLGQ